MEFVSHITLSFAVSTKPTKLERAREATINMGSAVSVYPCSSALIRIPVPERSGVAGSPFPSWPQPQVATCFVLPPWAICAFWCSRGSGLDAPWSPGTGAPSSGSPHLG